jgi:uncharacterized repeat protein (TIGR03803 family)
MTSASIPTMAFFCLTVLLGVDQARAQSESVVYSFKGGTADGSGPEAGLTSFHNHLYGTTTESGANEYGTIFSVSPSGTEVTLHSFGGNGDGTYPFTPLTVLKGTLYGTTFEGGSGCSGEGGCGILYKLPSKGLESVLHTFDGSDGQSPKGALVQSGNDLFGTTEGGGAGGGGTFFSVNKTGKTKLLYSFGAVGSGAGPEGALLDVNGLFYGTTYGGGTGSSPGGTVFSISKSGSEKVLYTFQRAPDGDGPVGGLVYLNGIFYGATQLGGTNNEGSVFSVTPSGHATILHSFGAGSDGYNPEAGLTVIGNVLYGTTYNGGSKGYGTVYSITTSGVETVLHSFSDNPDGRAPVAGLLAVGSSLYGTTYYGGLNNQGTVFQVTP